MSVLYLDEHLSCSSYVSDYNIGFKSCSIKQGDFIVPENKENHCIFFLMSGDVELSCDFHTCNFKKGIVWFVPMSSDCKIYAKSDIKLILNYFNNPIDFCEKTALESLLEFSDQKSLTPILKMNNPLKKFLLSMIYYMNEGAYCKHFHEIKQKELFYLLRYFYTKKELAGLFAPIISNNLNFKNKVLANYLRASSVKELAQICNYSLSSFSRTFKLNFRENPYIWLQNQKVKHIIGRLSDKNISFGQIIDEFHFSSPSHFTIFCKKHLNSTPSQFRKQHVK